MRNTKRPPEGYFPVTYEQIAAMTGQTIAEMKRSEAKLIISGFIDVIKRDNVLYVKLNLPT